MPTVINKHGLARHIPEPVKRAVRQACANGCVICGRMPYEYDHFDPPFEDAKDHHAVGIALLCSVHHTDRTAGRLSVDAVRKARVKPFNAGRASVWSHHLTEQSLTLNVAGNILQGPSVGLSVNGAIVFGLRAPGTVDGQWLVTGSINDSSGRETLRFRDNEVLAVNGSWDVSMEGPTITVRRGTGDIVVQVSFRTEDQVISLERLNMRLGGGHALHANRSGIQVSGPAVNFQVGGNIVIGATGCAIRLGRDSEPPKDFATLAINFAALGSPNDWRD
ncbi:hypothetical protein H6F95_04560 [Cyanobacteria bacterium FACHB-471]|nr:hypothetical protein [Cyanobacteria bacterium FACHB-471]